MGRGSAERDPRQDEALWREAEGTTPKDLDDRAALGALLGKEVWPIDAATVQRRVRESLGADRLSDLVARLPADRTYQDVAEVWTQLTGEPAERRF